MCRWPLFHGPNYSQIIRLKVAKNRFDTRDRIVILSDRRYGLSSRVGIRENSFDKRWMIGSFRDSEVGLVSDKEDNTSGFIWVSL